MRLLNSQKNTLYRLIKESDFFSTSQFLLTEKDRYVAIEFKESEFFFRIHEDSEYHNSLFVNCCPGSDVFLHITSRIDWDTIVEEFWQWLENLKQESEEPDLWKQLEENIINFSPGSISVDNSKFTAKEYINLSERIELLSAELSKIPLLLEQQTEIKSQLKRITELAVDLGKFDWANLFIGTIMSIMIQLGVTIENMNSVWSVIKSLFKEYLLK